MTIVGWADVFTRKRNKDLIIDSLKYCIENKGLNVYAFCLMTNHLHLIVNTNEGFELKDVIRDFKKHTSKQLIFNIENYPESRREYFLTLFNSEANKTKKHKNFKVWQAGNHAIELYSEKFVWENIQYIHNNPLEEGYVTKIEDWKYSSASNYLGEESVLEQVVCLTPQLKTV
ncbi:MAG: transposase [Crocinitomicaceae bacterium]|nr:transposase [Crocinitomicaceae bacterium]